MTMQQRIGDAGQLCRHNLFLALKPPPRIAKAIGLMRDRVGHGDGRVRDDRLHLTLLMICRLWDGLPPDVVASVCRVMDALTAEAFDLTFDRFGPNGTHLALFPRHGRKGLRSLRQQCEMLVERTGLLAGHRRSFNPHMSLFYQPAAPGAGRIAPICWQATDIVLIDSHVGLTRHVEIARWPLIEQWRLL